jgi:DNA polymerase III epsilon subunit family exonuclease
MSNSEGSDSDLAPQGVERRATSVERGTMKWRECPIVAFDTETTGLEPFGDDRMIEFAAVVFHLDDAGHIASREDHSFLINPGMSIPAEASLVSGITDDDVKDKPGFEVVAGTIKSLLADAVTVAHNYPFDLAFVTQEFQRIGQYWPEPVAEIDTVDLSMRCFPDADSHKLADLCSRLNVRLDGAHRATNDAAATGECMINLARTHQVDDNLQRMLDWAHAIGRPPEEGPIGPHPESGRIVFHKGPHEGEPVSLHPIHLYWMSKARVYVDSQWHWRFPDDVRAWITRWFDVRGSGRNRQNPKSFDNRDWVIDPIVAQGMT